MNDDITPVSPINSETRDIAALITGTLQTLAADGQASQQKIAETQAQAEERRLKFESEKLAAHTMHTTRAMWMDFAFKMLVFAMLAAVVTVGFLKDNMGVVTHAVSIVAGIFIGVGYARSQK